MANWDDHPDAPEDSVDDYGNVIDVEDKMTIERKALWAIASELHELNEGPERDISKLDVFGKGIRQCRECDEKIGIEFNYCPEHRD